MHKLGLQTSKRYLELCIVAIYCSYSHTFQSHMYSKSSPKYCSRVQHFNTHAHKQTHTHTVIISVVVHAIYANYQLHYALLECSRLGCLRGCPGGGGELISSRTRATHGQLPIESIDARETGAKKTRIPRMRRASFERYFRGWQDQRDFLCA